MPPAAVEEELLLVLDSLLVDWVLDVADADVVVEVVAELDQVKEATPNVGEP